MKQRKHTKNLILTSYLELESFDPILVPFFLWVPPTIWFLFAIMVIHPLHLLFPLISKCISQDISVNLADDENYFF